MCWALSLPTEVRRAVSIIGAEKNPSGSGDKHERGGRRTSRMPSAKSKEIGPSRLICTQQGRQTPQRNVCAWRRVWERASVQAHACSWTVFFLAGPKAFFGLCQMITFFFYKTKSADGMVPLYFAANSQLRARQAGLSWYENCWSPKPAFYSIKNICMGQGLINYPQ